MSIPGSVTPLFNSGGVAAAAGGYQIERSLRFSSNDSAYLSRAVSTTGNRTTFTFACWIKLSSLSTLGQYIFSTSPSGANDAGYLYYSNNQFIYWDRRQSADGVILTTNAVYRDPSAWYHLVFSVNYSASTSTDRAKIYVNGIEQSYSVATYPNTTDNSYFNVATTHYISAPSGYVNAYLADVHFIDGQALTPSSFTEVSATTGQLIPKAYTGSFGTNGFWLKFSDNSAATATTLGKDYSGNSNNWTPNNLSVTAGAGNDSLVDTPTSYGTDTGAGGEVRGNYATLNPLLPTLTPTNGNLDTPNSAGQNYSTIAVSTGKWYVETTVGPITAGTACGLGLHFNPNADSGAGFYNSGAYIALLYENNLSRYEGTNSNVNFYPTAGAGSILAFRLDLDSGTQTISYYVNNVLITSSNLPAGKTWFVTTRQNNNQSLNFGQRPFAYTAPSGFKALCDTNLTAPVVAKSSTVMDVVLYTGNSTDNRAITGLGFSPDLVWFGPRSQSGQDKVICDSVRGVQKALFSNQTYVEADPALYGSVGSFDPAGFTIKKGADATFGFHQVNLNSSTYAAWCWDAGTTTSSNTQGSITSQVRANASAGFSIVSYTGTGSTNTVGHGLNVAPSLIICKTRAAATQWVVYHASLGKDAFLGLNTTDASITYASYWGSGVTSTVFGLQNLAGGNNNGSMIAYCFAPVAGYSSAFTYTGNGSNSGPFVYLGFRPRFFFVKRTDAAGDWWMYDAARNPYNVTNYALRANSSAAEVSDVGLDMLSNGFRYVNDIGAPNISGASYVGFAFAESPFQYARAR